MTPDAMPPRVRGIRYRLKGASPGPVPRASPYRWRNGQVGHPACRSGAHARTNPALSVGPQTAFNGSVADVENALAVLYYYPDPDFVGDASFELQVADGSAIYLPATGHFYKSVPTEVDYASAKADASTFMGMQGYLFTVTSEAEKDFVEATFGGRGWMCADYTFLHY